MRIITPRLLAVLVVSLAIVGCSNADESDTTGGTSTGAAHPPSSAPVLRIVEVRFTPDLVVLQNFSTVPAELGGRWLCDPPACAGLPSMVVEAGALLEIALGDGSADADIGLQGLLGPLAPGNGELGLYSAPGPEGPAALEAYLEWGSTPHEGTAAAVASGRWPEGSYAPAGENAARLFVDPGTGLWLWEQR